MPHVRRVPGAIDPHRRTSDGGVMFDAYWNLWVIGKAVQRSTFELMAKVY